jgi:hypothetical protein
MDYSSGRQQLPGISGSADAEALSFQMIESVRRIRFIDEVKRRAISPLRADPGSQYFDPVRAAILRVREGDINEAGWLIFVYTHFGKNLRSGYQLARDFYGRLGQGGRWDWISTSRDVEGFRHWLDANEAGLRPGSVHRAFGNHRKYQSLNAWRPNGTGDGVQSYVAWVKSSGDHTTLFSDALERAASDPELGFRQLYGEMRVVRSFGRMARFDYLSMIGKVGIASIRPDSVHFEGATGPVEGAKLLFFNNRNADVSAKDLERLSDTLAVALGLDKQAMEDSICNWQKSPSEKIGFRG